MSQRFLITGANRGIGLELARQLVAAGHSVVATARKPSGLESKLKGNSLIYPLDVGSPESIGELAGRLDGPIDVLINNAGVIGDGDTGFETASPEKIMESFTVNALGAFRVTQALLKHLERGTKPKVVNITSQMGSIADNKSGGYYGYRMSKAALNMFTKSLAVDFPKWTVLCLHPGWVQTDMGGREAPVSPEDSARGLIKVIEKAGTSESGRFFNFRGEELPW
jgi:NAD(P)-dependent dehydrogenase (short-subunit alcohol dehydrogenase family)